MLQELENLEEKYHQLTRSLSDPALISDPQKIKEISKERASLEPIIRKYEDYKSVNNEIKETEEILADTESESDLKKLAETEREELIERKERLEKELKILLLPKDPNDERNVILEIRAGAGGVYAVAISLFAFRCSLLGPGYSLLVSGCWPLVSCCWVPGTMHKPFVFHYSAKDY